MSRDVDPKTTRKALRLVRKIAQARRESHAAGAGADGEGGEGGDGPPPYSGWEKTFLEEVEGRLETYGSAFRDLSKGRPEEALSHLQAAKLREIAAKAAGKPRRGFKPRGKPRSSRQDDAP